MGHSLNSKFFGNTHGSTVKVHYNNGSVVVSGYISKQLGPAKFAATSDGVHLFPCQLSPTLAISPGQMTIYAYPIVKNIKSTVAQHVKTIDSTHVFTVEGNQYNWTLANTSIIEGFVALETN